MMKQPPSDRDVSEAVPAEAVGSERVTDQEHKLLFARWQDKQRQEIAEQSEPTVNDIAEAYEMPPDEVYRQLREVRVEQERRRAEGQVHVRLMLRAAMIFVPAMIVVGLIVVIITAISRVPHPPMAKPTAPLSSAVPQIGTTAITSASEHDDRGNQLYADKRYAEAEPEYVQAVQEQPGIAMYHNDLGNALYKQAKYAEAVSQFRRAAQMMPERAIYQQNLAETLRLLTHFQEAVATYRTAIALAPDNAVNYFGLGEAFAGQKNYAKAVVAYQQAIRLKPGDAQLYSFLGDSYRVMNKNALAEQAFRQALRLSPGDADVLDRLGMTVGNQKRIAEAAGYFGQALALDPKNVQYRKHVAQAAALLKRRA